jgi:membrane protein DedA with SNARE-associated domain
MHTVIIYALIFIGVFFEGEFTFTSAIITGQQQHISIAVVIIIGFIATVSSDLLYFSLGRYKGRAWILKKPRMAKNMKKAETMFEKRQNLILFSYRFLFGFRTIVPILAGMQKIPPKKFVMFSLVGTTIWVLVFSMLGIVLGKSITTYMHEIEHAEFYIIGGLIAIMLIIRIYKLKQHSAKQIRPESDKKK